MVPTIAEITPTLSPMIMLLRKAGQNWSMVDHLLPPAQRQALDGEIGEAARGEGEDHQEHDRRQQEDDEQGGDQAPRGMDDCSLISGTTTTWPG